MVGSWRAPVTKFIAVPASSNWLILLDHMFTPRHSSNLLCVDGNGVERWRASLPTSPDSFVDVKAVENSIFAWTWSCYRLEINVDTGATISMEFTK